MSLHRKGYAMGRFRRRKQGKSSSSVSQESSSTSSNTVSGNGSASVPAAAVTTGDRKFLWRYLNAYREGAFAALRGESLPDSLLGYDAPSILFDVELPALNNIETLRRPYLALAREFSDKQRRMIHEFCALVGLYHLSVGSRKVKRKRYVAISIYADGFEYLPDFQKEEHIQDNAQAFHTLSQLKPWALKKRGNPIINDEAIIDHSANHTAEQATKMGRDAIYQFIDQPGDCLRDGVDFIDFHEVESLDLSQSTPPSFETDAWVLVDSPEKMQTCVQELEESKTTELAFDMECYNKSKYVQVTCLIQLAANNGKEYVIDPLAPGVWDAIPLLAPLFANPDIVKIGHSIGGLDVRSLHRDFGIFVVNAFDTYEAAIVLGLPSKGLAKVCAHYGMPNCTIYEALKEEYQTTDWTRRPLTEPMIRYGRYDVHYLIRLRKLMMRDLVRPQLWDYHKGLQDAEAHHVRKSMADMMRNFDEDGDVFLDNDENEGFSTPAEDVSANCNGYVVENDGEKQSLFDAYELRMNSDLMQAISRSQDRCLDLWSDNMEPPLKNADFQSLLVRCKGCGIDWTLSQLQLYEDLATWRHGIAAAQECAASFVCSLGFLATVAFRRPTNEASLKIITVELPELLQIHSQYLEEMFALIRRSRAEDGLCELEDLSLCPRFDLSELEHTATARELFQKATDSSHRWVIVGLMSCAALVLLASVYKGRWQRTHE